MVWFGNRSTSISSENHLDIEDSGDHVDLSDNSPTIGTENAFLMWIRPQVLGHSSHINHPGIAADSQDAFDGFYSFQDQSSDGPHTSGTHDAEFRLDTDGGTENGSSVFSLELAAWHLVGFSVDANDVLTWYLDGSSIGTTDYGTFDGLTLNYIGYGYGSQTNDGSGDKDVDEIMIFDREVTETEVNDFWNAEAFPSPAAHHYRFDNAGDGTVAVDSEGNEDGTIVGGTYTFSGAF